MEYLLSPILRGLPQTECCISITRCAIASHNAQNRYIVLTIIFQTMRDAALGCDARLQFVMLQPDARLWDIMFSSSHNKKHKGGHLRTQRIISVHITIYRIQKNPPYRMDTHIWKADIARQSVPPRTAPTEWAIQNTRPWLRDISATSAKMAFL